MEWLHANGCPWDCATTAAAAQRGRLVELQWLREHGAPWDAQVLAVAAGRGHLLVMRWAREHGTCAVHLRFACMAPHSVQLSYMCWR